MATRHEIGATYDYMDEWWRLTLGPRADITAALYDENPNRVLEEAQAAKHTLILDETHVRPGSRLLDIGCGWGGLLYAARARGAVAVGITLSSKQANACVRDGLDARLLDWNDVDAGTLGRFDAIASVGAFEHFCSPEQFRRGEQDAVYRRFFGRCHGLLRAGGRLFLQTMLWGAAAPPLDALSPRAPFDSAEYLLAALLRFYPGSWLPSGLDQICRAAGPWFHLEWHRSGREDYILTMREWHRRTFRPSWGKLAAAMRLLPRLATDGDLRRRVEVLVGAYNQKCLERRIMEHERIVFRRLAQAP